MRKSLILCSLFILFLCGGCGRQPQILEGDDMTVQLIEFSHNDGVINGVLLVSTGTEFELPEGTDGLAYAAQFEGSIQYEDAHLGKLTIPLVFNRRGFTTTPDGCYVLLYIEQALGRDTPVGSDVMIRLEDFNGAFRFSLPDGNLNCNADIPKGIIIQEE